MNLARLVERDDLDAVLDLAREQGGAIFVGLALTRPGTKDALQAIDDAAAEIAARIGGQRQVRRGGR